MARRTEADEAWERAEQFARDVIAERIAMDRDDPDWDLLLETARERWIGPAAGPVPEEVVTDYQATMDSIRRRVAMVERMEKRVQLR